MQIIYINGLPILLNIIFSTIIIAIYGYYIFHAIKKYNHRSLELKSNLEEVKSRQETLLLETELEIQEETFQYISKEIHDNITQGLSLAKLNLSIIEVDNVPESKKLIYKSTELIAKALSDLSHLSKSLDADIIESHGLIDAINYELDRWRKLTTNNIVLEVSGDSKFLPTDFELLTFRIIQESMNNIIKYAVADNIKISMHYKKETFKLNINDDGVGFDPKIVLSNKKIGTMAGIKNMRQRAESMGGTLIIESKPGMGTQLDIIIPLTIKPENHDQSSTGGRPQIIA